MMGQKNRFGANLKNKKEKKGLYELTLVHSRLPDGTSFAFWRCVPFRMCACVRVRACACSHRCFSKLLCLLTCALQDKDRK